MTAGHREPVAVSTTIDAADRRSRNGTVPTGRMPVGPGIGNQPGLLPDAVIPENLDRLAHRIELERAGIPVLNEVRDQPLERQ
jgi:hypothetical protein